MKQPVGAAVTGFAEKIAEHIDYADVADDLLADVGGGAQTGGCAVHGKVGRCRGKILREIASE